MSKQVTTSIEDAMKKHQEKTLIRNFHKTVFIIE
jgi:hypothetical protein